MRRQTLFGRYSFDHETLELLYSGRPVDLPPTASRILDRLLRSPNRLVTREDLFDVGWHDTVVEYDQSLNTCIRQIRQALGEEAGNPIHVETISGRGYRFRIEAAPGRRGQPGRSIIQFARGRSRQAITTALAIASLVLLFVSAQNRSSNLPQVAVSSFLIEGFTASIGGIDEQLEQSVRRSLSKRGVDASTHEAAYELHGHIAPTDDGALLTVRLVRRGDRKVVWSGSYNPFCPDIDGNPATLIGRLVAGTVVGNLTHVTDDGPRSAAAPPRA